MEDSRTNARLIGNCREYRRQTPINKSNSNRSKCSDCSIKRCSIRNVNYIKENLKDKTTQVYFQYQRLEWTLKTNFARHRNIKINGLKGWYENSASTHLFHITWRYYERKISRSLVDVGSYKSLICIYKMGNIGGKPPRERLFGIIELKLSPLRII